MSISFRIAFGVVDVSWGRILAIFPQLLISSVLVRAAEPESESSAPPRFSIHLLGFEDSDHTYPDGTRGVHIDTQPDHGMSSGVIAGQSSRYTGDFYYSAGHDAWAFSRVDQSLRQLGLLSDEYYIPPTPSHRSTVWRTNDVGQVIGTTSTDPTSSSGRNRGWFYEPSTGETTRIGYSTLPDRSNMDDNPLYLQPDGFVVGTSDFNSSTRVEWAWSFDPDEGFTRPIGLPESTDLGSDGGSISEYIETVTPSNLVVGSTTRRPSTANQQAIWVHRPGTDESERIGLYGGLYVRNSGDQLALFDDINAGELIVGRSHFSAPFGGRAAAWLYDSNTRQTVEIGLANPTSAPEFSEGGLYLTDSDTVVGTTSTPSSQLTWLFDYSTNTTSTIGLSDPDHIFDDGSTYSEIDGYSESSFVYGISRRREGVGSASRRTTAWIYSPITGTVSAAGLNKVGADTLDYSRGVDINESGQVIGTSYPQLHVNVRPWFFDPETEQTIHLAPDVVRFGSIRGSSPRFLNESGQVVGIADKENGGSTVWFYDHRTGSTRYRFDYRDQFTSDETTIHQLTESGLVLGSNERSTSGDERHTPWLYDFNTGQTHSLIFSESSGGQALSHIAYLSDDGVVLGEYDFYSDTDEKSRRYFYWSIAHGFYDLEALVEGDLSVLGWDSLATIADSFSEAPQAVARTRDIQAFDGTFLWAYGTRSDGVEMPFALVQVPEPGAIVLGITTLGLLSIARLRCSMRTRGSVTAGVAAHPGRTKAPTLQS